MKIDESILLTHLINLSVVPKELSRPVLTTHALLQEQVTVQPVPMDGLHSEILPPLRHNNDFVSLIQVVSVRREQDQPLQRAFRPEGPAVAILRALEVDDDVDLVSAEGIQRLLRHGIEDNHANGRNHIPDPVGDVVLRVGRTCLSVGLGPFFTQHSIKRARTLRGFFARLLLCSFRLRTVYLNTIKAGNVIISNEMLHL